MTNNYRLKQLLICKICNQIYDEPIILPCGNFICSSHAYIETTNNLFKCKICNIEHPIPTDGFSENKEINQLIDMIKHYKVLYIEDILSEKNKKAIKLCNQLDELIKKSEKLSNDPYLFIYDYFSKNKSDLDLNREEFIERINENYYELLNEKEDELSKLKSDLKLNRDQSIKVIDEKYISLINEIDNAESTCKANIDNLERSILVNLSKRPNLNDDKKWSSFTFEIEREISKLKYMIEKFQSELLSNKLYEINSDSNENNLGDLLITSVSFPKENRLHGTIKFELNEFKSLRFEKSYKYDRDWCIIDNIRWTACACIQIKNDLNLYLALFAGPDCFVLSNPIRCKITFKLLKENGKTHLKKSCENTFDNSTTHGYEFFCSMKEIFDQRNEIYDKKTI